MAEFWTGDLVSAEKHLQAAVDYDRSGGVLRPHLNAAAYLALLQCERGDLDAADAEARAVIEHATDVGWTVSAQVVAAYLTLAWVALDRDDRPEVDGWLGRVAEVETVIPEPHVQLAAAALSALLRGGRRQSGRRAVRPTADDSTTRSNVPPALADRLTYVEADLLCRIGDVESRCSTGGAARSARQGVRESPRQTAPLSGRPRAAAEGTRPFPMTARRYVARWKAPSCAACAPRRRTGWPHCAGWTRRWSQQPHSACDGPSWSRCPGYWN